MRFISTLNLLFLICKNNKIHFNIWGDIIFYGICDLCCPSKISRSPRFIKKTMGLVSFICWSKNLLWSYDIKSWKQECWIWHISNSITFQHRWKTMYQSQSEKPHTIWFESNGVSNKMWFVHKKCKVFLYHS